ncbi:MAG: GIY-YIG nuclease family protein, partial [Bacteroidetes bacterium]|nr:GIY-YIG nuclease family protein [Bacteroidota bacterium]
KHLPSFLPSLSFFLNQNIGIKDFQQDPNCLKQFANLDDHDIWSAIKLWVNSQDNVLSTISKNILERKLFKIELTNHPCTKSHLQSIQGKICKEFGVSNKDINYFVIHGSLSNSAYISKGLPASEEGKFFAYVIECEDGSLYKGCTNDLSERWYNHKIGKAAEWTKSHKPKKIIHWEEFNTEKEAIKREKFFKSVKGRHWLKEQKNKGKLRQAGETINILMKNGEIVDVAQAADLPNIKAMSKIVKKYYLCYPKFF